MENIKEFFMEMKSPYVQNEVKWSPHMCMKEM